MEDSLQRYIGVTASRRFMSPTSDNDGICSVGQKELKNMDICYTFKTVGDRLIGCNGDCGSKISAVIDYCVHGKVM